MPRVHWGQYPAPSHVIAHVSDTHLLGDGDLLYGAVDVESHLRHVLDRLVASASAPDVIVFTGDLVDAGQPEAYRALRAAVEPVARELGAELVWVMGNHDERSAFRAGLFDEPGGDVRRPVDYVRTVRGLRVIALDTSIPGWHHGRLDPRQLVWLGEQLSSPAEHGTIIALHHPPIPTPIAAMQILELERQDQLAAVLAGTDVIGILGGHLHYATSSMFAGVPVSVAAATCYTMDLGAPDGELVGMDSAQTFNLVQIYDGRMVSSVVPLLPGPVVTRFGTDFVAALDPLTPDARLDRISRRPDRPTDD